jgi:AcrR family transcriptional regulator
VKRAGIDLRRALGADANRRLAFRHLSHPGARKRPYYVIHKHNDLLFNTRRSIGTAFITPLGRKQFEQVTVQNILDDALVNRKTFYNYYQSPHQVLDELENELAEEFVNAVNASDWDDWYDGNNFDFHKIFTCVTRSVQENREIYRYLLKIRKTSDIMIKIENRLKVEAVEYFSKYLDVSEEFIVMIMEYVISGMFAVYSKWFSDGQQVPAEEVAKKIGIMSISAVNSLLDAYDVNINRFRY